MTIFYLIISILIFIVMSLFINGNAVPNSSDKWFALGIAILSLIGIYCLIGQFGWHLHWSR